MSRIISYFTSGRKSPDHDQSGNRQICIIARHSVPQIPGRLSLAQLPDHILMLVLSFIKDEDPDGLRAIAAVNTALHGMVRYILCHTVQLNMDDIPKAVQRLDMISEQSLLRAVRVLKVSGGNPNLVSLNTEKWDIGVKYLGKMMQHMTGLREFHWRVGSELADLEYGSMNTRRQLTATKPIPLFILDHLDLRVRLYISIFCGAPTPLHNQVREFFVKLEGNHRLVSLSIEVLYRDWQECRGTMALLKRVLLSCPNLKRIPHFVVGYPSNFPHGLWHPETLGEQYCGLGFSNGERPAALKEFGIERYPWGHEYKGGGAEVNFHGRGYPEKGKELEYWAKTFDWSQLERLYDLDHEMAVEMAPKLSSLKEIEFKRGSDHWSLKTAVLLETMPSTLELLSINCWSHIGDKPRVITRHGADLETLRIHEPYWTGDRLITNEHLYILSNGLPQLRELELDISRNKYRNDWPWHMFDNIARFPSLRTVRLWFELGVEGEQPLAPYITVAATRRIFKYLQERNKLIRRLELGTRERHDWNFALSNWSSENSMRLVCEKPSLDDTGDSSLKITCPILSKEMNENLALLAGRPEEERKRLPDYRTRLLFRIALEGPLNKNEWVAWRQLLRKERPKLQRRILSALPFVKK